MHISNPGVDEWDGLGEWRATLDERRGLGPKGITEQVHFAISSMQTVVSHMVFHL